LGPDNPGEKPFEVFLGRPEEPGLDVDVDLLELLGEFGRQVLRYLFGVLADVERVLEYLVGVNVSECLLDEWRYLVFNDAPDILRLRDLKADVLHPGHAREDIEHRQGELDVFSHL